MQKFTKPIVILTEKEYEDLTNPNVTYSLMTKTSCEKGVKNLLLFLDHKCWHDYKDASQIENWCCSNCIIMDALGDDVGSRICLREKRWME